MMRARWQFRLCFAVLAVTTIPSLAMDLVRDGQAVAVVVAMSPAPQPRGRRRRQPWNDQAAARVLVEWVKKITDAELPIVEEAPPGRPAVLVGAAALEAGLKLEDIESPSREGFRIVCDGERILLAGQCETATVKAVCRLLETLGCRYLIDHPLGEVFPRKRTLSVGPLEVASKPGFLFRSIWGSRWSGASLWKVWNGAGGIPISTGHAWGGYIEKSLFDQHPEYFALRGGERRRGDWLCTSNRQLRDIFARAVIKRIRGGNANPSISPPDGRGYCECPACRAQDDPKNIEPSSGRVSVSNRYADFFDYVGRRVAEVFPRSILNFYCYADYTQPPTLGRRLSGNLCAWIAPIRYCRFHRIGHPGCPSRTQLRRVIEGWRKAVGNIGYRTYNYNLAECTVPFSKLSVWAHDIPYLKAHGCIGVNLETLANWEIYGPHIWLSIRLAYEPQADAGRLIEDYFASLFGPKAGPPMKQYWLAIDHAFEKLRCHSGSFFALHRVYTPGFIAQCSRLLDQATGAAADDPTLRARVEMFRQAIREAMNRGDFAKAKTIYEKLYARNEAEMKKGLGNHYTLNYLRRFVGKHLEAGAAATAPPSRRLAVLPDRWRLAYDPEDKGLERGFAKPDFNDSAWRLVATYSDTLDAQGLPDRQTIMWYRTAFEVPAKAGRLFLFFTEVDGDATVFVNGREVGTGKKRTPFEVEITQAARPGKNTVAVRVDHRSITELFLGGIIRPVLLIARPK